MTTGTVRDGHGVDVLLRGADLSRLDLAAVRLDGADLTGARLEKALLDERGAVARARCQGALVE